MKTKLTTLILVLILLTGCAHIKANPEASKTIVEIAAFTLGYEGVDRYPRAFNAAADFVEKMLPRIDATEGQDRSRLISVIGNGVIDLISDHVQGDPLLEHHGRKLLDLIYIEIPVGSYLPLPEEQSKLLLAALPEFVAGVRARQGGN